MKAPCAMNGSHAIAQILRLEGVEQVFCFPYTPLLDALAVAGIRPIVARQERVAENMADGFSRASCGEKIGVVTLQQSAGAENGFAGIAQANTDSSSVLFLLGHSGRNVVGVPPNFDAVENFKGATKWADRIPSVEAIPQRMRRAFMALRSGRPGPVLLEVPVDLAREEFGEPLEYRPVRAAKFAGDPDAVREAVALLLDSQRPMIWAGQGVLYAGASAELTRLAEALGAPVMTTLLGKSAFNERHPLALGIGSMAITDMARDYLEHCDTILAIGSSLSRSVFIPEIPADKKIIHVTVDPRDVHKDYVSEVAILGDARLVLGQILDEMSSHQTQVEAREDFRQQAAARVRESRGRWKKRFEAKLSSTEVPLNPYRVIGDLMKVVDPKDALVTHESGGSRDQLAPLYESVTPRGYLGWGHSTQLGFSLGAAMGAKLACPDKLVVNVMGDAAFGMVGMDVETAVRENIPILTVLLNNSAMGNYEKLIPKAVELYGIKRLSGNYTEVARGLGVHAERIEKPSEIVPALQRAMDMTREGRPALLEFITREEPDIAYFKKS